MLHIKCNEADVLIVLCHIRVTVIVHISVTFWKFINRILLQNKTWKHKKNNNTYFSQSPTFEIILPKFIADGVFYVEFKPLTWTTSVFIYLIHVNMCSSSGITLTSEMVGTCKQWDV